MELLERVQLFKKNKTKKKTNVLIIGGNGNISWWCSFFASKTLDFRIFTLTRGLTEKSRREIPEGITKFNFDVKDTALLRKIVELNEISIVCDFICFDEETVKERHAIFKGLIKQYIFVSTVSIYERRTSFLPYKENSPKWALSEYPYASNKILAEKYLMDKASKDFAVTIVRPGHTYDTIVPIPLGHNCFTMPQRILDGKPILIPGDGTNLWTICHSSDFANAFVGLINNSKAFNEDFHITGDEVLTWVEVGIKILKSLNREENRVIHVPLSQIITMELPKTSGVRTPYFGKNFIYQRLWCDIYDNSKIKSVVPGWGCSVRFEDGIKMTFDWLMEREERRRIDQDLDTLLEKITLQNIRQPTYEFMLPFIKN